jgi:hypothetical protein
MKISSVVTNLTPEQEATQTLVFSLVGAANPTRARGKPQKGKKKPKGRGRKA